MYSGGTGCSSKWSRHPFIGVRNVVNRNISGSANVKDVITMVYNTNHDVRSPTKKLRPVFTEAFLFDVSIYTGEHSHYLYLYFNTETLKTPRKTISKRKKKQSRGGVGGYRGKILHVYFGMKYF